jgi:uncharacterized membrane protein
MKRSKLALAGAAVAIALGAAVMGAQAVRQECMQVSGRDTIVVSETALARGVARFFCYRDDSGKRIRFLLARDSNGDVHGVFDACHQCYKYHKGYEVSGGDVVCRFCRNRYKIGEMQTGKASCVPVHLAVVQSNQTVRVKVADIQQGRSLF